MKTYSQRKIEEFIRKTWCCKKKKPVTPASSGSPVVIDTGCELFTIAFDPERPPSAYNISIFGEDNIGVFQTDNDGGLVQTTSLPSGNYWIYVQILESLGRTDIVDANSGLVNYTTNTGEPSQLYTPMELGCGLFVQVGIG